MICPSMTRPCLYPFATRISGIIQPGPIDSRSVSKFNLAELNYILRTITLPPYRVKSIGDPGPNEQDFWLLPWARCICMIGDRCFFADRVQRLASGSRIVWFLRSTRRLRSWSLIDHLLHRLLPAWQYRGEPSFGMWRYFSTPMVIGYSPLCLNCFHNTNSRNVEDTTLVHGLHRAQHAPPRSEILSNSRARLFQPSQWVLYNNWNPESDFRFWKPSSLLLINWMAIALRTDSSVGVDCFIAGMRAWRTIAVVINRIKRLQCSADVIKGNFPEALTWPTWSLNMIFWASGFFRWSCIYTSSPFSPNPARHPSDDCIFRVNSIRKKNDKFGAKSSTSPRKIIFYKGKSVT